MRASESAVHRLKVDAALSLALNSLEMTKSLKCVVGCMQSEIVGFDSTVGMQSYCCAKPYKRLGEAALCQSLHHVMGMVTAQLRRTVTNVWV